MTDPVITVHPGNISTYEGASDEFLKKRKTDLRSDIRNPHLTAGEFVQGVVAPAAISGGALGWSAWFGAEKLLPIFGNSDLARHLHFELRRFDEHHRRRTYAFKLEEHKKNFQEVGENWAFSLSERKGAPSVEYIATEILHNMEQHKFQSGIAGLRALIPTLKDMPDEETRRKALLNLCEKVKGEHPEAHLGKVFDLLMRVEEAHSSGKFDTPTLLIKSLVTEIEKFTVELESNNEKIIAKYRNPLIAAVVTAAVAVAGVRAYRTASRDKTLNEETEIGHIERLQSERAEQASPAQQAPARA